MDLMLLGEGEEMVPELCDLVIKAREEGWSRSRLIEEAVNIPGVYAPSLYTHDANGRAHAAETGFADARTPYRG